MKVKKFKAPTMQEAMKQVRLELGDHAVIIHSKAVKKLKCFGLLTKKSVEVIAAVDEAPHKQDEKAVFFSSRTKEENSIENTLLPNAEIMDSLKEMKRMMRHMAQNNLKDPNLPDYYYELMEKLACTDLPKALKEQAMEEIYQRWLPEKKLAKHEMIDYLHLFFHQQLIDIDFDYNIYRKKFICLVGPTGVGKTTTLAKLAADAVLKHGKSAGFITTDTYRIAAIEQLKIYANILGAPLEVCYSAEDVRAAKQKLANLDVVFVDTAGRNFLHEQYVQELQNVIHFDEEVTNLLVLSLTSKTEDMKSIVEQFWRIGIDQFLFTKQDETVSTGAMYALIHQFKRGAVYITNGQNVPEDMTAATKDFIVHELIEVLKK